MNGCYITYADVDLIKGHISDPEPVDFEALEKEIMDSLTDEQKAHNEVISDLCCKYKTIMAKNTLTGQTEEYFFAEHFNIGPGWMMMRVSNPHLGIVSSFDLTEVVGHTPL